MRRWVMPITLVAVILTAPSVAGADDARDLVNYRQSVMRTLNGHIAAIMDVVRGRVSLDGHIALHARAIEDLSRALPDLFPPGTGPDAVDTNALQVIWSDGASFESVIRTLQDEASALTAAAVQGDHVSIAARFTNLRRDGCDACHSNFRKRPSQ